MSRTYHKLNAFIISAIVAIIFVTFLTIAGELYAPLKEWLKAIFYHHWVGKGVLSFLTFFVLGVWGGTIQRIRFVNTERLLVLLVVVSVLGSLSILGFFTYETLLAPHT